MLLSKLIELHSFVVNQLLPPICVLCRYPTHTTRNICSPCHSGLPILTHHCEQCARFLPQMDATRCGACLVDPPPFSKTVALFPYESVIIHLVQQLKFQHQLTIAQLFGDLLASHLHTAYTSITMPDVMIPVPLHPSRLRERGFNQALEIGRPIARKLKLPLQPTYLVRSKETAAQSGLNARLRKKNIAHAFQAIGEVSGKSVAILDDVVTTGSTVTEISHTLKKAGAKEIHIWCAARRG